jgi:hypothetical protein
MMINKNLVSNFLVREYNVIDDLAGTNNNLLIAVLPR